MHFQAIPGKAKHADSGIELLQQIGAFSWSVSAVQEFCDSEFAEGNFSWIARIVMLHLYSLQPLSLFVDLCFEIFHFILFTFQFAFLHPEGEPRLQKVLRLEERGRFVGQLPPSQVPQPTCFWKSGGDPV